MDSRKLATVALLTVGMLFGIYAMVQILTQGWNAFTEAFKYLGGALLLMGFFLPRFGFWVLLVSMGYLDLVKRLLVVAGTTTYYDIAVILAFSPILALVVFAGIVVQDIRNYRLSGDRLKLFAITCAGMLLLGGSGVMFVGGGLGGLKLGANYGAFVSLIYIVPALFNDREGVYKMLRGIVLMFIPVALYAFWQSKYGMTWWEVEYLETGLSSEIRILWGQDFRIFSTLNSSQNLAKVMAMAAALTIMIPWSKNGRGFISKIWATSLFVMFFTAAYLSGSRTGLVMGIVAIGCYVLFRSKVLTITFYAGSFSLFILVVLMSDSLLQDQALNRWTGVIATTFEVEKEEIQSVNLATLSVRLESFDNLKDPDYWTPFGFKLAGKDPLSGDFMTHDMLGRFLVAIGYVPLTIVLAGLGFGLWKLHHVVWKVRHLANMKLLGISLVMCILVGGLSSQENIGTFPVNALLYIAGGVVLWATSATKRAAREAAQKAEEEPRPGSVPIQPGFGGLGPRPSVSR